jgi:3-oxoacyl-[acyl-carrier-protein] synthase III
MIGIEQIGVYIPDARISNDDRLERFGVDRAFLTQRIGVRSVSVKSADQKTSDLCVAAFDRLCDRTAIDRDLIDALVVITQNPDTNIPHTSAIVHGKIGLPEHCACFDVSLGCSGYVYGLSIITAFLERNGLRRGLLFTADPYSNVVDSEDRNTALLFGDAATVSLIGDQPVLTPGRFTFGTIGKQWRDLSCRNGRLHMNGRAIFTLAATQVPEDVARVLERNGATADEIDVFLFHQGSKFIVDTIASRLKLPREKVVFDIERYGNTVSSSLPLLLEPYLTRTTHRRLLLSGFGVGLSWASTLLYRSSHWKDLEP